MCYYGGYSSSTASYLLSCVFSGEGHVRLLAAPLIYLGSQMGAVSPVSEFLQSRQVKSCVVRFVFFEDMRQACMLLV